MSLVMSLLSAYWPYLIAVVSAYVIYIVIFGNNKNNSNVQNNKNVATKSKPQLLSNQSTDESTVYKDDDGEEDDDEVSPTTFPEDTPHIPYEFKEISEVSFCVFNSSKNFVISFVFTKMSQTFSYNYKYFRQIQSNGRKSSMSISTKEDQSDSTIPEKFLTRLYKISSKQLEHLQVVPILSHGHTL